MERWTTTQVDNTAGDDKVRAAGAKLATPLPWSEVGIAGALLFGRCKGSGKKPYDVSIDLSGPRYKCSCPSLKFPCKHCLGLMYLWANGHVNDSGMTPEFAAEWEAKNTARAAAKQERADAPRTEEQIEAAQKRVEQREANVDAGAADLEKFLADLISQGLANSSERAQLFTDQAKRLVDAQAPGLARRVERLAQFTDETPGWTENLVREMGLVHLLAKSWLNRAQLPEPLAATVRQHVGFSTRVEDVLATPGVRDTWAVVGAQDVEEGRISVRRVWMWGTTTEKPALVLFYGAATQGNTPLTPHTQLEATLHFYPGQPQLRAAIGADQGAPQPIRPWDPTYHSLHEIRDQWRGALAADPWLISWPVITVGVLTAQPDEGFALQDAKGDRIKLVGSDTWELAAALGDQPAMILGEVNHDGLSPHMFFTGVGLE